MTTTEPAAVATAPDLVPQPWRVRAAWPEIAGTTTLELEPVSGAGMAVAPGQFTMLSVFGVGEAAISVSGDPGPPGPLLQTVRAAGAVSAALVAARPGDVVGVRGPFGRGWGTDRMAGRDVVIVAGGIGLAPLRPLVATALARRPELGRVALLYGGRTPDHLLYPQQLHAWRSRFDLDVLVTVDRADAGWYGEVGVVPTLVRRLALDPANTVAYVCGPEVMMRFTAQALADHGLAPDRIELSLERTMRCGVGLCGHCQLGPLLICRDGPVVPYSAVRRLLPVREV
jgi:NAD(P)H-flavin reductase